MDSQMFRVAGVRSGARGAPWSFAVGRGEAVWIPDDPDAAMTWLDWLTGITTPPEGDVFWKGVEWRQRSPDAAATERGRIGCVFATGGLVVNLDLDENVWLPARMHRWPGAAETIEEWARFFGCWPLPAERAPTVPERQRRRMLWTRAMAGNPEALVLEHPLRGVSPEEGALFLEGIRKLRAAGTAVAWIAETLNAETQAALAPLITAASSTM